MAFGILGSIASSVVGSVLGGGGIMKGITSGLKGLASSFLGSIFGGSKERKALSHVANGISAKVRHQPDGKEIKAAADRALAENSGPKVWNKISKEIDDRLTQMDIEGNNGKEAKEERAMLGRLKKVAKNRGSTITISSFVNVAMKQQNGPELQQRANRALANNASPEEWANIAKEANDRKEQIELNREGIGKLARMDPAAELKLLDKIIELADKKSGKANPTEKATGTEKTQNTAGNAGNAGNDKPQSTTRNEKTQETEGKNKAENTQNTGSNEKTKKTANAEESQKTNNKESNSKRTSNDQNAPRFESTANSLNDLINEAKHAYTGNDPKIKEALANIESLDDELQTELNKKPPNLEKIKALTEKLSNALDKLGNKFPADSKMAKLLGKAEASAEKLLGEVKSNIAQMAEIKETADKLNDKINESKHAYKGDMPKETKEAYAKLEAADDKLQRAINEGKSPAEIRKLAIEVSNLADKLGNKLAADPKQAAAASAMKSAEGLAEKLIGQSSGTTPPNTAPETPPKADSAISVDQNSKTIRIDADKDGKDDYEIKMMGKGQAWEVTQLSTGEKFKVWGDPHVDLNSQNKDGTNKDFDFKNTSTFVLPGVNGSEDIKITAGTTQYKNSNKTVTDTLTITTGDDAVKVTGIADNKVKIGQVTKGGEEIDAATNDGHVFRSGDHINDMQVMTEDGTFEDADKDKDGTDMHAEGERTQEYNG